MNRETQNNAIAEEIAQIYTLMYAIAKKTGKRVDFEIKQDGEEFIDGWATEESMTDWVTYRQSDQVAHITLCVSDKSEIFGQVDNELSLENLEIG